MKYDSQQNKAFVYLIDIYHLVIPTELRPINQHRPNPESLYLKLKGRLKESKCGLESLRETPVKLPETINN